MTEPYTEEELKELMDRYGGSIPAGALEGEDSDYFGRNEPRYVSADGLEGVPEGVESVRVDLDMGDYDELEDDEYPV